MQVRVVLRAVAGLLAVSWVSAQAPYPPSGYRPPGRQFTLPTRPTDNRGFGSGLQPQNQYVPPTNQYGPPDNRPQNTEAPPPSQYLPGLQPTDFRFNVGQTNRQQHNGQSGVSSQEGQQQYGFSGQNQQQDSSNQQFGFGGQQAPQQQYGFSDQNQVPNTDFRINVGQTNRQHQNGQIGVSSRGGQQQYGFTGQNQQQDSSNQPFRFGGQQAPQQQYSFSDQNLLQNRQQLNQNRQLNQNGQQYYRQQQSSVSQSKNVEQQSFIGQGSSDQNQGFGTANVNNRQRPLPRTSASERNYLAPTDSNLQQQRQLATANQQIRNFVKQQTAKQQLYQTPTEQGNDEESANNQNDQAFSGNDDQNLNVANQNYLPPTTTERRRYPEPTTRRPDTREAAEPEDNEAEEPNVAIATAVAKGQYYLWQPDGRLQRVVYKTTQTEEDLKNNAYSAKLVYQAVQPITAPIYTYSAPLLRFN